MATEPVSTASSPPASPPPGIAFPRPQPPQYRRSDSGRLFGGCWSCRFVSAGGLLMSAAYVFHASRKVMRQGGTTSMGTVLQISLAACLAAGGIVIIFDPKRNAQT